MQKLWPEDVTLSWCVGAWVREWMSEKCGRVADANIYSCTANNGAKQQNEIL